MRILIACHFRDVVGGTETYLRALLPALAAHGHQLAILHEAPATAGAPSVDAGLPAMPTWCAAQFSACAPAATADWRPDVVYLQGLRDVDREAVLCERYPTVLFAHNYYGACISGTKRFSLPGACPCTRVLGPACLGLYLPRRCGGLNPLTMWRQYRRERTRQQQLWSYRAVLVASRHMLKEYCHGVSPERLHLAPLFPPETGPDDFLPDERPSSGRILFVGRLTDLKGCHLLVPALARAAQRLGRGMTLDVAGDGPDQVQLEQLAERQGVPVAFHGWVTPARREELMRQADLLAVPSVWPEPFGLVGLEAGCVGLPSVGFAVGGIPDWLIPGESGELAPGDPPTVDGLADAVVRALADKQHLSRLRRGAWEVSRRFTLKAHLDILEPVLARVAEGKA